MVATVGRYLDDLGRVLKPASVRSAEIVLRQFAGRVTTADPGCRSVAAIGRGHVEDYKSWLAARPGDQWGTTVRDTTIDHHLGLVVKFFERAVTWGYADVPPEPPINRGDRPKLDRPGGRRRQPTAAAPHEPVATPERVPRRSGGVPEITWDEVASRAPQMVATMHSYLDQLAVSARPATVLSAGKVLRLFAGRVSDADPGVDDEPGGSFS